VDDAKTSSGDQSHHHEAVFNVVTGLHCVIPVVECLRYVAAQTNQQNQKRTELKKLLPHLTVLGLARPPQKRTHHLTILVVRTESCRCGHLDPIIRYKTARS